MELDGARMECDRFILKTSSANPPEILGGTATGSVVVVKGEDRVTAKEARFDLKEGTVDLSGSPRLARGDATISALRIIYRLDQGTADFQGGVSAEFASPGK